MLAVARMSRKAIVQPLAVKGLMRLLEKLTGMKVSLSIPRQRGTCFDCGHNVALRNDGTAFTHYRMGSDTAPLDGPRNCPGSNKLAL